MPVIGCTVVRSPGCPQVLLRRSASSLAVWISKSHLWYNAVMRVKSRAIDEEDAGITARTEIPSDMVQDILTSIHVGAPQVQRV